MWNVTLNGEKYAIDDPSSNSRFVCFICFTQMPMGLLWIQLVSLSVALLDWTTKTLVAISQKQFPFLQIITVERVAGNSSNIFLNILEIFCAIFMENHVLKEVNCDKPCLSVFWRDMILKENTSSFLPDRPYWQCSLAFKK